ncbi:MAG: hypothetical protein ACOYON_04400 [Fimbriimonas sp.]
MNFTRIALLLLVVAAAFGCSSSEPVAPETKAKDVQLNMTPEEKAALDEKFKNTDLSKIPK